MQRVLIIGPCGAGKSTLASALSARLDLPVFHMDRLNWQPGWVESDPAALRSRLADIISRDKWLIDGNYGGTLAQRLERADTVVYLDFPIMLCLYRIFARVRRWRGHSRPDMTDGCPERLDIAFLFYVLRWRSGPGPRTEAKLVGHEHKVIRLCSPATLQRWMDSLPTPD